jgi:uncharacterized protein DUF2568
MTEISEMSRALGNGRSVHEEMKALPAVSLAIKFALELGAIAAFALWGATVGTGVLRVLVATATPLVAIALWGAFAAPKAKRRLPTGPRIVFELLFFGLAAAALLDAELEMAAAVLACLTAIDFALLTVFHQWER